MARCWVLLSFSLNLLSLYTYNIMSSQGISLCSDADDTQLLSYPPCDTPVCLIDIFTWMAAHHLNLHFSKTKLLFLPVSQLKILWSSSQDLTRETHSWLVLLYIDHQVLATDPQCRRMSFFQSPTYFTPLIAAFLSFKTLVYKANSWSVPHSNLRGQHISESDKLAL